MGMTMTKNMVAVIEVYGDRAGQWVSITEVARLTGLSAAQLLAAFRELADSCDDFRVDQDPMTWRHDEDTVSVTWGGEPAHLIRFEA